MQQSIDQSIDSILDSLNKLIEANTVEAVKLLEKDIEEAIQRATDQLKISLCAKQQKS